LTFDSHKIGRIDRFYNAWDQDYIQELWKANAKSEMFSSYDNNNINPENDNDCTDGFDDSRGSAHAGMYPCHVPNWGIIRIDWRSGMLIETRCIVF